MNLAPRVGMRTFQTLKTQRRWPVWSEDGMLTEEKPLPFRPSFHDPPLYLRSRRLVDFAVHLSLGSGSGLGELRAVASATS